MSIFYDGVNTSEIEVLYRKGILRGITTNLTLINKEKLDRNKTRVEIIEPIAALATAYEIPISIQLESNSVSEMIEEAHSLKETFQRVPKLFIKVPVDFDKLEVINTLSESGILINATCITARSQAQLAVEAGSTIVSFFWGKMSDQGINPYDHVYRFTKWKKEKDFNHIVTLVGSVRQVSTMYSAYDAGANVVTTSFSNIKKFTDQLLSTDANNFFQQTNVSD